MFDSGMMVESGVTFFTLGLWLSHLLLLLVLCPGFPQDPHTTARIVAFLVAIDTMTSGDVKSTPSSWPLRRLFLGVVGLSLLRFGARDLSLTISSFKQTMHSSEMANHWNSSECFEATVLAFFSLGENQFDLFHWVGKIGY
eukprot:Lithocolla_globosa_v1_NODE_156_length_5631_cov_370.989060.p3 type:complete len:141 gc:universal NODE_156_length_5631_cov_370.989060:1999-1577(-)